MYEVVNPTSRETIHYYATRAMAESCAKRWYAEVWQVADDEHATRMVQVYPEPQDEPDAA